MSTSEPIRNKTDLNRLSDYFLDRRQYRNYTMIILGSCTALRISDLLKLRWDDVYDFKAGKIRSHIMLTEKKTGKFKKIALCKDAISALQLSFSHHHGDFIFSNGRKQERPISRVQAWRIIHDAAKALNIPGQISTHSLRKTWGYHAWSQAKYIKIDEAFLLHRSAFFLFLQKAFCRMHYKNDRLPGIGRCKIQNRRHLP